MVAEFAPLVRARDILAGTRADLQVECYRDGIRTNPSGTPTCTVTDATGAAVATPTVTAADGILTATLSESETSTINDLTVVWANLVFSGEDPISITESYRIVGSLLFTVQQAREVPGEGSTPRPLGDENKYPVARIWQERERITHDFEDILGYAIGSQYQRDVLNGTGREHIWLKRRQVSTIRSVEARAVQTWTAYTAAELNYVINEGTGRVLNEGWTWPKGRQNIRIAYEHGMQPIPPPITYAALILLRERLTRADPSQRAITQVDPDLGTFQLATPGRSGSYFGLPAVDEVLHRWSKKIPGIA